MVWHGDETDFSSLCGAFEFAASTGVVMTARADSQPKNAAVIRI
jgi:hypothetical protein